MFSTSFGLKRMKKTQSPFSKSFFTKKQFIQSLVQYNGAIYRNLRDVVVKPIIAKTEVLANGPDRGIMLKNVIRVIKDGLREFLSIERVILCVLH